MSLMKFFDKAVLNKKLYDRVIEKVLTLNAEITERLDYLRPWTEIANDLITNEDISKMHKKWGGNTHIHTKPIAPDYSVDLDLDAFIGNILYHCAHEYSEKEYTVSMAKLYAESSLVNRSFKMLCVPKPVLSNLKFHMDKARVDENRKQLGGIITSFAAKVPKGKETPLAYSLSKNNFASYILNVTHPQYAFAFLSRLAENIKTDEFDRIFEQTKLLEGVAPFPEMEDWFFGVNTPFGLSPKPELWGIIAKHCNGNLDATFAHHNPLYCE